MRLVDADKVYDEYIEQMKELINSTTCENVSLEALSLLCGAKLLTDAPTIDPMRHGRWIQDDLPEAFNISGYKTLEFKTKCSECGFFYYQIETHNFYGWCPNCGAKMDEEKWEKNDAMGRAAEGR
jgi:hypothetical protein